MDCHLGYCTNVHAGANLGETRANLERYALDVKQRFSPHAPMGVGLWLSARATHDLRDSLVFEEFCEWLSEQQLLPFTFNGFPYGDFHQAVVKHRVYEPTWWEPERLEYTLDLIDIQHRMLPEGMMGSISTLPIAWPEPAPTASQWEQVAQHVCQIAAHLQELENETGRTICICFEPEPGCLLQRSQDVVRFFEERLFPHGEEAAIRRYIRVCHDVCHAVVMFEAQRDAFETYQRAGIEIGKMQISSAICADFESIDKSKRQRAVDQLREFAEDRYLHQTSVRRRPDGDVEFYEDLPPVLAQNANPQDWMGQWRTHFHVPIYLEQFGQLRASRADIIEAVKLALANQSVSHFEVETYAWGVLPSELQKSSLSQGIAEEMSWFQTLIREYGVDFE